MVLKLPVWPGYVCGLGKEVVLNGEGMEPVPLKEFVAFDLGAHGLGLMEQRGVDRKQ